MLYRKLLLCITFLFGSFPSIAFACSCGCGMFDVGTSALLPNKTGGTLFFESDFLNQQRNWSAKTSAPSDDNPDKIIRSQIYTLGGQYMFNQSWGIMAEVPYWKRTFRTTDEDSGDLMSYHHSSVGDVRLRGIYSGFDSSMSSGITFGLKLPTGDFNANGFDRDTQIGTGSTNVLLGAYHMGWLSKTYPVNWFTNTQLDIPAVISAGYRPGTEVNTTVGLYYEGWDIGNTRVAPIAQVIGSFKEHDRGPASKPDDSGYEHVYLSPGLEMHVGSTRFYTDVAFPIFQRVNGNQLVARELFKFGISRSF